MRELKIRIWHDAKKDWIYLDLSNITLEHFCSGNNGVSDGSDYTLLQEEFNTSKKYLYTGLKDKSGKEIYEDDVIRILYTDWPSKSDSDERTLEEYKKDISGIGVVKYFEHEYRLQFNNYMGDIIEGRHGEKEVIGNIYENPELLEKL